MNLLNGGEKKVTEIDMAFFPQLMQVRNLTLGHSFENSENFLIL